MPYLVRFNRGGALRAYAGLLSETPSGFWLRALKRLNGLPFRAKRQVAGGGRVRRADRILHDSPSLRFCYV